MGPIGDDWRGKRGALAAIVLAAGFSSRMGAFKPLLEVGGKPLIRHVLEALEGSGLAPVIVVTGHRADALEGALRGVGGAGVRLAYNPHYAARGMLSSLLMGIEALPADGAGFLLALIDQPLVAAGTVRKLAAAWREKAPPLALPLYRGQRGHPAVISSALIPEIRALGVAESLRDVVHRHLGEALLVEVEDAAVLDDLDTPEDFARMQAREAAGRAGGT